MKNNIKKDNLKNRLVVVGGIVIIVILIVMIGIRFKKDPVTEAIIPEESSKISDVVLYNWNESLVLEKENEISVEPEEVIEDTSQENGSIDTGEKQKIQEDITEKPTYTKEQLEDPTQMPNGEKVETTKVEDNDKDKRPNTTPKPKNVDKKPDEKEKKNPSGGVPGFDNVPDAGPNTVKYGDSDGDINKQVGIMD